MAEKKNYLPVIWQSILVGSFLIGVGMGWAQINGRVKAIETAHQFHCMDSKDRFAKVPDLKNVELQFAHISKSLEDIKKEVKTLQTILIKMK